MDYTKLVKKELKRCINVANKHYNLEIPIPDVEYTIWKSMAGQALIFDDEKPLIKLSDNILRLNGKRFVETVVPHEVAHIVEFYVTGDMGSHGKTFKYILGEIFECDYLYAQHELKT
jgi:SprT protein